MFVRDSYDNYIFVVCMTFTFKTTDVLANNVTHLRYMAETLLRLAKVTRIQRITCISAITAVAAQCIAIKC